MSSGGEEMRAFFTANRFFRKRHPSSGRADASSKKTTNYYAVRYCETWEKKNKKCNPTEQQIAEIYNFPLLSKNGMSTIPG